MMKAIHSLLLLLVLALPSHAAETIVIGVDPEFPPFSSITRSGFIGFDVELARALGKAMDAEVGLVATPHTKAFSSLKNGTIDAAISGISRPSNKVPGVAFSIPYFEGGQRILVRNEEKDIHSIDDLNGLIVGTRVGASAIDVLYDMAPMAMVSLFTRIEDAYRELARGDVDAVVFDSAAIEGHVDKACKDKMKTVGPVYAARPYVVAMTGESSLKDRFDKAIRTIQDNGDFEKLRAKWFDREPAEKACDPTKGKQ